MKPVDALQGRLRELLAPLDRIAALVPSGGTVLELGCGQGLLIERFAGRARKVVGVDYDPRKCALAREALARFDNVEIIEGTISAALAGLAAPADAIVLSDVLSSMSAADQETVLAGSVRALAPGGTLLLKIVDVRPRWKAAASRLISGVVYRGLKLSRSDGQRFQYRPRQDYLRTLQAAGFRVDEVPLDAWLPVPHVALVARRTA